MENFNMSICTWLSSSLERNYPETQAKKCPTLAIDVALNEHFSFQLVIRNEAKLDGKTSDSPVTISVRAEAPEGWKIRIRCVGYVPMLHRNTGTIKEEAEGLGMIPGYVPDPLFEETTMFLPANETHAFWFSVKTSAGAKPGKFAISAILAVAEQKEQRRTVKATLHNVRIAKRQNNFLADFTVRIAPAPYQLQYRSGLRLLLTYEHPAILLRFSKKYIPTAEK